MAEHEYYKLDVWDRLWPILFGRNGNVIIYVYRVGPDGRPVKPSVEKSVRISLNGCATIMAMGSTVY